jgi:GNAT superfamily N-acetyltransferase
MSTNTEIGRLKRRDLESLLMIARVFYGDQEWLTTDYLRALEKRALVKLTARWEGRLVGGAIVVPAKAPNVWLAFMVVDKNVGRRGIGEQLFKALEKGLESGTRLWHTLPDGASFKPSAGFLSKMGLEKHGQLDNWYGKQNGLAFSKVIR